MSASEERRKAEEVLIEAKANVEINSMMNKEAARIAAELFNEYINHGFTREEALMLVISQVKKV